LYPFLLFAGTYTLNFLFAGVEALRNGLFNIGFPLAVLGIFDILLLIFKFNIIKINKINI